MPFDLWLAFAAASCALVLIPGPTVLLVLSYALSQGRAVALATAAGVALGDFLAMSASLAGLGALVMASATAFTVLKWAGAAYLVWLGLKMLHSAGAARMGAVVRAEALPARGVFAHAAAVTALNPKSIGFFIAFVPQFVNPAHPVAPQFATMIATFVGIGALNALAYALLADRLRARIGRPGAIRWMTRAGGAALIGMGVLTATLRRG
ncbi:Threonine/homoserine/homoserine lactone efflux protein [Salinihabitans flavidus]|uniref:Threonine/homoserine/homoserine lactone efflux protein n=1 Tax=Salinihabitans flavidus TaxID=569882 RepID=A0A1H8NCL1_9RHOB|nr:LysE family translocator [Salinihabitans flavidus]SEO27189.1 Threonine/homoserine/homoserine lactone efflux protein [Salinihabitans flavidus]